jgi:hypothetical protein
MSSLKEEKLIELLEAIQSMLVQGNADAWLDLDTINKLSHMEGFVRAWLEDESAMTEKERVSILANLTETLKPKILTKNDAKITLH